MNGEKEKFPHTIYASIYYPKSIGLIGRADIMAEQDIKGFKFTKDDLPQFLGVYELKHVVYLNQDANTTLSLDNPEIEIEENVK